MLRRSRNSAADADLRLQGNSENQSNYAALVQTPLSSVLPCSIAPQAAPSCFVVAYDAQSAWHTHSRIDQADPYPEHPFTRPGSQLHLEELDRVHVSRLWSIPGASPNHQHHYLQNYVDIDDPFITSSNHSQYQIYEHRESPGSNTTPITFHYSNRGMQPLPQEFQATDNISTEEDSAKAGSSDPSKKRQRDVPLQDDSITLDQMEPPLKKGRTNGSPPIDVSDSFLLTHDDRAGSDQQVTKHTYFDIPSTGTDGLEKHQRDFVHQWVDIFVVSRSQANLSNESMNALATLTQARPQLIFEYIRETHPHISDADHFSLKQRRLSNISSQPLSPTDSREPYTLASANAHLPPTTLHLVTRYINSCRRTRPRNDGRRSVNSGPYRCLHGCGYRTKRAFDWRRHEETHEPQELWLCTLCTQQDTTTTTTTRSDEGDTEGGKKEPFLVSRKDKFLKHARESHKEWGPERVLDLSRVDYRPSEELKCPFCGGRSKSWDERCRHVLGHFEEQVEREREREGGRDREREGKSGEGSVVSVGESPVSDGSEEDRFEKQLAGD